MSDDEMDLSSSGVSASGSELSSGSDGSDNEDFSDFDDDLDGEMMLDEDDEDPLPMGVKATEFYHVWTSDSLRDRMQTEISSMQSLLCVDYDVTLQLLLLFKWDKERLREEYFAQPERTMFRIGVGGDAEVDMSGSPEDEIECFICFDDVARSSAFALDCGHLMCSHCWADYLRTKLPEQENSLMTRCPRDGCARVVSDIAWSNFLTPTQLTLHERFKLSSFARGMFHLDFKVCPMPGCQNFIHFHSNDNIPVECLCNERFCYNCQDADLGDHSPCTCEDAEAWTKKNSDESENITWIKAKTKACPKCRKPIEKNGGCMHMTCRTTAGGCGHEFCWLCFGNWRGHSSCNKTEEGKKAEVEQKNAENELGRYMDFHHRYSAHKQAADIAKKDKVNLLNLEMTLIEYFDVHSQDLAFLKPCLSTLQAGRQMLSWSYVRKYYSHGRRISTAERNMFNYGVDQLEVHTDRLQESYEQGKAINIGDVNSFLRWKQEVANLTRVAMSFFDSFVESVIKGSLVVQGGSGLSELERFYAAELTQLAAMGFTQKDVLINALESCNGSLEAVLMQLVK